jgi:hypothetical protein
MKLPTMFRTSSLKASYATGLGYGPAGAGKTRSTVTLQQHGFAPFVIATEPGETSGLLSLGSEDIHGVVVTSHEELIYVVRELKKKPGKIEYQQQEFGSVVLDSLTAWGEFPLERYMQLKGWKDLHDSAAGKDPRGAYGYLAEKGRQLYKELFSLHGHLWILAREGLFGGGDEALFAAPELPGQKLPREAPGWSDLTVRLRVVAGKHVLITQGEGGSPGRVRLPRDMPVLPTRCNQDIGALFKFMLGDKSMYDLLVPDKKPVKVEAAK